MVRALEIYDTFNPKRLLEIRFVVENGEPGRYSDFNELNRETKERDEKFRLRVKEGTTFTGRTFRSSYSSLRRFLTRDYELKKE